MARFLRSPVPSDISVTSPWRRLLRRVASAAAIVIALLLLTTGGGWIWVHSRIKASLPQLDGTQMITGLSSTVEIERDELGVPTIRGVSEVDTAKALGFLHAQDRFFQMDLLRRQGAAELADIFGPAAAELDRQRRIHRFRNVARHVVAQLPAEDHAVLKAYAEGANAGRSTLRAKPFEYLLLRTDCAPWQPEDSILVFYAMFFELQDARNRHESVLGYFHDTLPRQLFEFIFPTGTEWDAPLLGDPFPQPSVPGPDVVDLRKRPPSVSGPTSWQRYFEQQFAVGSNNWAIAGTHSADGHAWLANDTHLALGVPNVIYRASVMRPDGAGGSVRITGATLPGAPVIVAGSNGHVSWGLTNAYGDSSDLVVLETNPNDPDTYRTTDGWKRFEHVHERVRIKGRNDETLEIRQTIWGPVIDTDHRRRPRVLAWTAHHPEAVDLGLRRLEGARSVDEALDIANRSGIPAHNVVVVDKDGQIGWTIGGRIPRRMGFDGRIPASWADGLRRWDGWLRPQETPRIVNPSPGQLWTANARVASGDALAKIGDGGYELGARARQIRDALMTLDRATPNDLLAIQLDNRALFLEPWRRVLLAVLTPDAIATHQRRRDLREVVEKTWTGEASVDSAGYRAVRGFRNYLLQQVFAALTNQEDRPAEQRLGPTSQFEGPLWQLVTERPLHLLSPRFRNWDEQLLAAVDQLLEFYATRGPNVAERTWGEFNTTRIRHPLSNGLPLIGRWLDMPSRPLPGDANMPRVQGPNFGAAMRLVVSPGREELGFFHMAVGQSGHPLSPFYRKGHEAWQEGKPTPFLPGQTVHRLRLQPSASVSPSGTPH